MKVLHISRTMGQGGAEKIVLQLCAAAGSVEHAVISCGGSCEEALQEMGVPHFWMPDIDRKNPATMWKCFVAILKVVKQEKIHILHSHHRMAAFYARIVSLLLPCKCVYTAHNVFYGKKTLFRFAVSGAKIVAVGKGVKENLVREYGQKEEDILVIPNAINKTCVYTEDPFLTGLRKDGNRLFGSIGRITRQKGVDVFIKAVAQVIKKHPWCAGIIVGDGEERKKMEQLVDTLQLRDHIFFLGYQPNVLSIIRQLDAVVLASRWEGLPLTPIEAFSQGKAVIASDISGNNELVEDGFNGFLFPMDDDSKLAEKMLAFLDDKCSREEMEKNALDTYEARFSYEAFLAAYRWVYDSVFEK